MSSNTCLNCNSEINGKFCAECGQKADTHRITFKHFISHDILHGIFHVERGMLYTAKQALLRPGKAALDYIAGKRKPYYNVFLLVLFTFATILYLRHNYEALQTEPIEEEVYLNDGSKKIDEIFSQKSKIIVFLFVPLAALNSFLLFRRKKLNLTEHAIVAGMILLAMLLLSAIGNLLFYSTLIFDSNALASTISIATTSSIIFYVAFGYYTAFKPLYTKGGMVLRIFLFYALLALELLVLLYLLIGYATHWKFGTVTLSPFG